MDEELVREDLPRMRVDVSSAQLMSMLEHVEAALAQPEVEAPVWNFCFSQMSMNGILLGDIEFGSVTVQEVYDMNPNFKEESVNRQYVRSNSLPASICQVVPQENDHDHEQGHKHELDDLKNKIKKNCWWTRSNRAFLNEPLVIEGEQPRYKYASQYHVANRRSSLDNGSRKAKTNGNATLLKSKSAAQPDA